MPRAAAPVPAHPRPHAFACTRLQEKTGIDKDEIKTYFKDYDTDGNAEISKSEFMELMKSTGAFD